MDKFNFNQIIILILVIVGCTLLFGLSLSSCLGESKVVVTECPGNQPCSTITVRFKNMQSVPDDTLNATATRIIQELQR
jgi:hypothetical protein